MKSFVTDLRRALKVKGKSPHSGRGTYELYIHDERDWNWRIIKPRVIAWLDKKKQEGVIESYHYRMHQFTIKGSKKVYGHYCGAVVSLVAAKMRQGAMVGFIHMR